MDDFEKKEFEVKESGTLSGFDSASESTEQPAGYTVTPEGGFYSHTAAEIVQDEVPPAPKEEPAEEKSAPQHNFFPNGQYAAPTQPQSTADGYGQYVYAPPAPKKKKEKRAGFGTVLLCSLLAAVIGAASGVTAVTLLNKKSNNTKGEETVVLDQDTPRQNVNISVDKTSASVVEAVAEKVTPSVVGIRTTTSVTNFFGGSSEATGEGSGVVYSSDGYIITNYHVISGADSNQSGSKIEVFVDKLDGKSFEASVVGYNIASDLAVIKINVNGLTPIEIADSSELKIGQYVITVGNPGGLEFMDSVTYGVVSGLDRVVSTDSDIPLIQTDAAINPGNSGGALVNIEGKLVGINSSKIVAEEFEGMGFAIPSNTVVKICNKIKDKENSPEPYTGITISEKYTASVLNYYGYPAGAVVLSVDDGSPAQEAGLRRGDIITEFNKTEISEYTVLKQLLKDCDPGDKVDVKIYRSGRYYTTTIKVGSNNAVE